MVNFSRILKIVAKVIGIGLILWGIMFGVFGIILGIDLYLPDFKANMLAIFACIYAIGLGFLYWFPNKKILLHTKIYLTIMFLPIVSLIGVSVYEVLFHGFDSPFVTDFAFFGVLITICLLFINPLSFILYMKSEKLIKDQDRY